MKRSEITAEEIKESAMLHLSPYLLLTGIAATLFLPEYLSSLKQDTQIIDIVTYIDSMKWMLYSFMFGAPALFLLAKPKNMTFRPILATIALVSILWTLIISVFVFVLALYLNGFLALILGGATLFMYPSVYRHICYRFTGNSNTNQP